MQHCPNCGAGKLKIIAAILERPVIEKILGQHEDVPTAEICRAACASRRTLQYCFEEFLQTTPQTYLRALWLNEARRRLKSSADAQITFVATEFGFNSASHFTRQYRSMFGELPSQTMRASRRS